MRENSTAGIMTRIYEVLHYLPEQKVETSRINNFKYKKKNMKPDYVGYTD